MAQSNKEHEAARRALWAEALLIGSTKYDPFNTSYSAPYHIEFADKVLEAYDEKFPEPINDTKVKSTNG